ncbi:Nor-1 [Xylariaceae sp. FL0255]|nr:Nor-1 [Xylariaceae sp. FL0255]
MSPTTVLITGANRGLGRGLVEAYLSRPEHLVIASVRDTANASLKDIKPAPGSRLVLVEISNVSETDPAVAVEAIRSAGISSIDIVIANAAIANRFSRLEGVKMEDFKEFFQVNTFSVMRLFIAVYPLLKASADNNGTPKFIALSTVVSRITKLEENAPYMLGSYGASKAAVNYIVRRAHVENEWLQAFLLEPGTIQTDMGNSGSQFFGWPEAPVKVSDSVNGLLEVIDGSSHEATSGKFFSYLGEQHEF